MSNNCYQHNPQLWYIDLSNKQLLFIYMKCFSFSLSGRSRVIRDLFGKRSKYLDHLNTSGAPFGAPFGEPFGAPFGGTIWGFPFGSEYTPHTLLLSWKNARLGWWKEALTDGRRDEWIPSNGTTRKGKRQMTQVPINMSHSWSPFNYTVPSQ